MRKSGHLGEPGNFDLLAELSPDLIMRFDRDFRHLYVNRRVEDLFRRPVAHFIGKSHVDLGFSEDACSFWKRTIQHVFRTGKEHREPLFLPPNRHFDLYMIPEVGDGPDVQSVIGVARDVSDLKMLEKKYLATQKALPDAMQYATLAIWEYDVDSDVFALDKQLQDLLGLGSLVHADAIRGKVFLEKFVQESGRRKVLSTLARASRTRDEKYQVSVELRIRIGSSAPVTLVSSLRVRKNKKGRTIKLFGTIHDIIWHHHKEEESTSYRSNLEKLVDERARELKSSEERLFDALQLAKLGTWEFDFASRRFNIGKELLKRVDSIFELQGSKSFSNKRFLQLVHPEDRAKVSEFTRKVTKTPKSGFLGHIEYRVQPRNQEVRHFRVSLKSTLGRDGKHLKHYGTIQDITDIRKAEAQTNRLTQIIESTSDIVLIVTANQKIIYMNRAAREFYGLGTDEDLVGRPIRSLQSPHSLKLINNIALPEARRSGIWSGENLIGNASGDLIPVSQVILSHKGPEGSVEYFSSIIRDISDRKKIEQDLLIKNNELDTFVYSAGHDLKGPIASMIGLFNLAMQEVEDPKALEYFQMYDNQISRLQELVNNFLDLARINDKEPEYSEINFPNLIKDSINSFRNLDNFRAIEIRTRVKISQPFHSDKGLIRTILQNLIENAIKYYNPSAHSYLHIDVYDDLGKEKLFLRVSDNGLGIAEDIQDKVFKMFYRGNARSGGSGLGLYILKNAVERLDGEVVLNSRLGQGTSIGVIFPHRSGS